MELTHQSGSEAESLLTRQAATVLRAERQNPVHSNNHRGGWEAEGEKAPFLRNEPVRLTPAWEGSNLPNDTLNLKGVIMEPPPEDKWKLIYYTLILHGVGTLTAWNMFITNVNYFTKYKLNGTEYADSYMGYVSYAAQMPNFLFSWFNVFVPIGGDLTTRIVISLMVEVLIFVVTVVLAMTDTTAIPGSFFAITIASVFILNAANAVFQNSVYGVAGRLPSQYTGAVVLGSNVCGAIVSLLEWATSASGSLRTSAIYYFIGGMFVILVCFDTYFALPLNRFYRYHETVQKRQTEQAALGDTRATRVPYLTILRQCWVQLLNVWLTFTVTLFVFPGVQTGITSMTDTGHDDGFLGENFTRVTTFLTFNFMALFGSFTATIIKFPTRRWLIVATLSRLALIPFFLLCNYRPNRVERTLPILIESDIAYWVAAAFLGWSSGHLSSLGMMYVGGKVHPDYQAKAGMLGGAMLVTGIISGIALSGLAPTLVSLSLWKTI